MVALIRCETPGVAWTIEGKIEHIPGGYGGDGAHVGIDELSDLLAQHVDKWAKVRVELIDGPRPLPYRSRSGKLIDYEPSPRPSATGVPPGTGENCITAGCKAVATLGWHCAEHHAAFVGHQRVAEDLKRMRTLATRVRKHVAMVRAARGPALSVEDQCIDALAETMLVVCDQIEAFDRRLQNLETGSAT